MNDNQKIVETINLGREYQLGSELVVAVRDVSMEVHPGQFIAVVGRSGSGKTTLLNLMAGLDKATSGSVLLEGQDLAGMGEKELTEIRRHKIGFVFQSFGLLPLLSAFENVELPLRISGVRAGEREQRARDALEMVGLTRRSKHRPYELSGGEQQRVALGRAISFEPAVLCLDEPFSALDEHTRDEIYGVMERVRAETRVTVLHVTHSTSEATRLADDILQLRDGACHQQPNGVKTDATAG